MTELVTDTEERILKVLNLYDRLTRKQVNRALGYKPTTETTTWGHLKNLEEKGLVETVAVDLNPGTYSAPTKVYFTSTDGRKFLRGIGIDTPERKKIKEADGDLSVAFWRHALLVNDLMITAALWEKSDNKVEILGALNDIDLRRSPDFPIEGYRPDGWLEFTYEERPYTFCIELERGVYGAKRWEQKVNRMLAFSRVVDAQNLRFLVIAMEGTKHRIQLSEITLRTAGDNYSLFRVIERKPTDMGIFTSMF